jgi:hypothetical protein
VRTGGGPVIKAMTKPGADGRRTLILGLDNRNVALLTSSRPIKIHGEEMGLDVDILIAHGPTLAELLNEMRDAGFEIPHFDLDKPITLFGDELHGKKNS